MILFFFLFPQNKICCLLQGCRSPLVVKFADTQKDKEMKKLQQMNANLLSMANIAGLGALGPQYLAVSIDNVDFFHDCVHVILYL